MALNGTATTHQTGIVRNVNDKGLKLEGFDTWFNVSKYAESVTLPERGSCVTVTLDSSGFIRRVDAADSAVASAAPQSAQGASSGQREGAAPQLSDCVRHRTITRLAVLKAAAEFGAARPSLKSGDVLAIAASWERWINREQETTYDLTDAF